MSEQSQASAGVLGHKIALLQSAYFLFTGIWPLVSIDTFQKVTGPKKDLWLVKTVGVLVAVIGAVLGRAGLRGRVHSSERLLATGSAGGLAAIDVVYVLRGRIRPVYLLDAVLELLFIGGWAVDADRSAATIRSVDEELQAAEHPVGEGYYISAYEPGTE